MKKERNSVYNKVEIKREGTIEENIDKLKKDLGVYLEGAEDIEFNKEKKEKFINPVKREKVKKSREELQTFLNSGNNFIEKKEEKKIQRKKTEEKEKIQEVAIFKYETAPKKDIDLSEIEIKSISYYNLFGKKIKEKTILIVGNGVINMPISVEKWINLPKEKKLKYLKVFQEG